MTERTEEVSVEKDGPDRVTSYSRCCGCETDICILRGIMAGEGHRHGGEHQKRKERAHCGGSRRNLIQTTVNMKRWRSECQ